MRKLTAVVLVAFFILLSACSTHEDSRFVDGSFRYTEENLPKICVTEYTFNDGINIVAAVLGVDADEAAGKLIVCENTDQCYIKLKNGECDIVLAHGYGSEVKKALDGTDINFVSAEIKSDALVFVTNSQTQVDSLTKAQVEQLFNQETTDWSSIKGDKTAVTLFGRPQGTAVQNAFEKYISTESSIPAVTKEVITSNGKYVTEIGYDNRVGAITYELLSTVNEAFLMGGKLLKIDNVEPNATTVNSGEYPFEFPILAVMRQADSDNLSVNNLYNWICDGQGSQII